MYVVSESDVRTAVDAIVREADPDMVVIFGSRARGDARPDSDVDILVVEREPFNAQRTRRRELARLERALGAMTVPTDIVLYSKEEVDTWAKAPNHVVARALREGKVVYVRK